MPVVGPGATPQKTDDPLPLLDRASELEYVVLFNPLSDDFAVRVAQDLPVNAPFSIGKDASGKTTQLTHTEQDARQYYGLNLKNPNFTGKQHVFMDTIIEAGKTKVFKGNEAQVAIRQLTNEVLQRKGHKRLMADPNLRNEVEAEIIRGRGPIQDIMDGRVLSPQVQINEAIKRTNEAQNAEEPAFPGLSQENSSPGTEAVDSPSDSEVSRRPVGRPKKTDS